MVEFIGLVSSNNGDHKKAFNKKIIIKSYKIW